MASHDLANKPVIANLPDALEWITQLEELLGKNFEMHPRLGFTQAEQAILGIIFAGSGVVTTEHIYTLLYGLRDDPPDVKIITVYMCKIRKKLRPFEINIQTVWGRGWYLDPEDRAKLGELRLQARRVA